MRLLSLSEVSIQPRTSLLKFEGGGFSAAIIFLPFSDFLILRTLHFSSGSHSGSIDLSETRPLILKARNKGVDWGYSNGSDGFVYVGLFQLSDIILPARASFGFALPVVEISDLVVPVVKTVSFSLGIRIIQCWETLSHIQRDGYWKVIAKLRTDLIGEPYQDLPAIG